MVLPNEVYRYIFKRTVSDLIFLKTKTASVDHKFLRIFGFI